MFPDSGAPTGGTGGQGQGQGGVGSPGAGQGGHGSPTGQPNAPNAADELFAGIDLDDLPPEVKAKLLAEKHKFATLQTSSSQAAAEVEKQRAIASRFQSEHDRMKAQLQQITGGNPQQQQQQQDPQTQLLNQVEQALIQSGVTPEQAKIHAPVHAKLLGIQRTAILQEVGAGFQTLVTSSLNRAASDSWSVVAQQDRLGAFQIPEVAEATWQGIQHLVSQNQEVTPDIVKNLRNMHYAAHIEANGGVPQQQQQHVQQQQPQFQPMPQQQHQPQFPNMATRFTYPGAGNQAHQPTVIDPNAPKHALNADTQAALASTFARMGTTHIPKSLQGVIPKK